MNAEELRKLIRQHPGIEFWLEKDEGYDPDGFENGDLVRGFIGADEQEVKKRIEEELADFLDDKFSRESAEVRGDFAYNSDASIDDTLFEAFVDNLRNNMGRVYSPIGPAFIMTQELFDVIIEEQG